MDQQDKFYLWLPIVIIVALLTAITFYAMASNEIRSYDAPNVTF